MYMMSCYMFHCSYIAFLLILSREVSVTYENTLHQDLKVPALYQRFNKQLCTGLLFLHECTPRPNLLTNLNQQQIKAPVEALARIRALELKCQSWNDSGIWHFEE